MRSLSDRIAVLALTALIVMFSAVSSRAQVTIEKINSDKFAGAGIYHVYRPGDMTDTKAPFLYKPHWPPWFALPYFGQDVQ